MLLVKVEELWKINCFYGNKWERCCLIYFHIFLLVSLNSWKWLRRSELDNQPFPANHSSGKRDTELNYIYKPLLHHHQQKMYLTVWLYINALSSVFLNVCLYNIVAYCSWNQETWCRTATFVCLFWTSGHNNAWECSGFFGSRLSCLEWGWECLGKFCWMQH